MRRLILLMAAMGAAMLLVSGVAYALTVVQCDGTGDQDPATGQCQGTDQNDDITGTDQADLISALGGFDVHQFDSVIDCYLLGNCLNTLFNRTRSHCQPPKKPVAQNKKWARTHRTKPPRSEQAVNYTEREL